MTSACAQIGREVGDCEINFVSDGGDNRNSRGGDGAGDDFFIERPEIFNAAAAAPDDQNIDR
jgi:hypothetical protein